VKVLLFSCLFRSICKELALTFLVCVFSLLMLILISRGIHMHDLFLGIELSFTDTILLFCYMAPMSLFLVLPVSCMSSVFLAFSRMNADRELIALKAGGISIYHMMAAPLLFSFVCLGMTFFISVYGISWGTQHFRSTILHIANTRAKIILQPGVFNRDLQGLTLFARKVDPVSGKLQQVIFEDNTRDKKTSITILAPEGEIITDEKNGDLVFRLVNGRIYREDHGNVSILEFADYTVRLNIGIFLSGIKLNEIRPNEMAWSDLVRFTRGDGEQDASLQRKIWVEIHKRWALPVACVVLGLFALPLACIFEGVRRQSGIMLALIFFLLYYSLFSAGMTMGEAGLLPPFAGLWLANAVFALAAGLGIFFAHKERSFSLPAAGARPLFRLRSLFSRIKEGI
jgi:lipopolysaccharide export system permease protein